MKAASAATWVVEMGTVLGRQGGSCDLPHGPLFKGWILMYDKSLSRANSSILGTSTYLVLLGSFRCLPTYRTRPLLGTEEGARHTLLRVLIPSSRSRNLSRARNNPNAFSQSLSSVPNRA